MKTPISTHSPYMSTHAPRIWLFAACCLASIATPSFAAPANNAAKKPVSGGSKTSVAKSQPALQSLESGHVIAVDYPANFVLSPQATTKPTAPFVATERVVLPNGLTLVLRRDQTAPRVAISLLVRAGAADETAETAGWRRLLVEAMLLSSLESARNGAASDAAGSESQRAISGRQLQIAADDAGGRLGATVGDDVIEFWAVGDSANTAVLLDLLLTIVERPRLSPSDVESARRRLLESAQDDGDDIAALATGALRAQIYRDAGGRLLAYSLPSEGTAQSLQGLTQNALSNFYARYFQPSRMTVALAGDIENANAKSIRGALEQVAGGRSGVAAAPIVVPQFAPTGKSDPVLIVRQLPTRAAWVFVSYRVAGSNSGDAPALRVMSALLGEAPDSRLARRLMGAQTLGSEGLGATATQAAISLSPRRFGSELVLFAQTAPSGVEAVKNALLDEVRKLRDTPPSETELRRAKNFARGAWAVEREGLRERAFHAALSASLNPAPIFLRGAASLPVPSDSDLPARLNAVTPADIRRVAQKYLDAYAVALIMPED